MWGGQLVLRGTPSPVWGGQLVLRGAPCPRTSCPRGTGGPRTSSPPDNWSYDHVSGGTILGGDNLSCDNCPGGWDHTALSLGVHLKSGRCSLMPDLLSTVPWPSAASAAERPR